ncbi:MAG: hypothetical protein NVSMB58_36940 [Terriglobales bacterium]
MGVNPSFRPLCSPHISALSAGKVEREPQCYKDRLRAVDGESMHLTCELPEVKRYNFAEEKITNRMLGLLGHWNVMR